MSLATKSRRVGRDGSKETDWNDRIMEVPNNIDGRPLLQTNPRLRLCAQ